MPSMTRVDAYRVDVDCGRGLVARLFADEQVDIDRASIAEAETFSGISASVKELAGEGQGYRIWIFVA